jgi:hypothetical protein
MFRFRLKNLRFHEPKANHIAHFEAMFDAKIRCFSAKAPQLRSSGPFSLNSKQLQPDYVSSYTPFKPVFR